MLNILAVDDEQIIADSMYNFLRRSSDMNIRPYKAYSGSTAIEILERENIDVVIADVCMPGMDGFELFDYMRSRTPGCKIIFITGFEEFENAYKALQYENVRYVLKTDGYERLETVLATVVQEIEHSNQSKRYVEKLEHQLHESLSVVQRDHLRGIATGTLPPSQSRFDELQLEMNVDSPVIVLVGRLDDKPVAGQLEIAGHVRGMLESLPETAHPACYTCDLGADSLWLLQSSNARSSGHSGQLAARTLSVLPDIQKSLKRKFGGTIAFAVSAQAVDWEDIRRECSILSSILACYSVHEPDLIVTGQSWSKDLSATTRTELNQADLDSELHNLQMGLSHSNREGMMGSVRKLTGLLPPETEMSNPSAIQAYAAVCLALINYVCAVRYLDSMSLSTLIPLTVPTAHANWGEASGYIVDVCERILSARDNNHDLKSQRIVHRIKLFVHDHLGEDLSLPRIAEIVRLNPSYLSRFFRAETGQTFSSYVREQRIQRAKHLLESTGMTVTEVASLVGFSSAKYFASVFKLSTGFQPHTWRDSSPM